MDLVVAFEALPWESPAPGVRYKAHVRGAQRVRLLEFAPGFEEQEWCTRGHGVHVLEGTFALRLRDAELRLRAGDVVLLEPGDADAHKAVVSADAERVRLLLFERT